MQLTSDKLKPGMKIQDDIYKNGALILPKNVELTAKLINLIISWDIEYIDIKEESKELIDDREEKQINFKRSYNQKTKQVINMLEGIKGSKQVDKSEISNLADDLMDYSSDLDSIRLVNEMKEKDYYTYQHCINVGIYASLIAKWLNYDEAKQKQLCMAALLHDIGKIRVPNEILNKPGELTTAEFREIKQHPRYGYEVIINSDFDKEIGLAVLQHHERTDGSGYPLGLQGRNISEFAKIIAVVDTFDAITSNRIYDHRKSPFDAVKEIRSEAFSNMDSEICLLFFNNILNFFVGSEVVLNTGEIAEIQFFHKENFHEPIVKIEEEIVDLSQENKDIVDVLIF